MICDMQSASASRAQFGRAVMPKRIGHGLRHVRSKTEPVVTDTIRVLIKEVAAGPGDAYEREELLEAFRQAHLQQAEALGWCLAGAGPTDVAKPAQGQRRGDLEATQGVASASPHRDELAPRGPRVDLPRPRDLLLRVADHFLPMREPARRSRNREEHREHLHGKSERLVDHS